MKNYTILFLGKTGAGKSSTLNTLFGLNWATDSAVACTRQPQWADLTEPQRDYPNLNYERVRVVDMPGISESIEADEIYRQYYLTWVQQADSLVWVTQADTRAYKQDQLILLELLPFFSPTLFFCIALNKIDCLGVDETEMPFDVVRLEPSEDQLRRLDKKIEDVYEVFRSVIKQEIPFEKSQVVPYTSIYGWGLDVLRKRILTRS